MNLLLVLHIIVHTTSSVQSVLIGDGAAAGGTALLALAAMIELVFTLTVENLNHQYGN